MTTNTYVILFLISVLIIGFITILKKIFEIRKRYNFTLDFFEKLKQYIESNGLNDEAYSWLTMKSTKMQNIIGTLGIMQYKPPYKNYVINNYELIINGLSELQRYFNNSLFLELANQMSQTLQDAIIRYFGKLEDSEELYLSQIKNPIIWFREGIRFVISVPFKTLVWFGILNSFTFIKLTSSILFKALSGIIALITFFSAIITIVLGYEQFLEYLFSLFP